MVLTTIPLVLLQPRHLPKGGAGNDILNMPADMDQITFSEFEIITQAAVTASDASQWHNGSAILNGSNLIIIDSVDISTIDLSKYTVSDTGAGGDAFEITVGTNSTVDATKLASSVGLNITGNAGRDVFTGTANADTLKGGGGVDTLNGAAGKDTIEGGDGADIIDGEAGQDTLTGGAGADVFTFVKGDHTATTTADIISAADKITDFAVSSGTTKADGDEIDWSTNGTTAAVAAATDAVAGTAQIARWGCRCICCC